MARNTDRTGANRPASPSKATPESTADEPAHREAYAIGLEVEALMKKGSLRRPAIRLVAEERGHHPSRIKASHSFFRRFNKRRLKQLDRIRNTLGRPVPWEFVRELADVPITRIDEVLDYLKTNGYHRDAIKRVLRVEPDVHGRRGSIASPPGSVSEGLFQIEQDCIRWLRRCNQAWSSYEWGRGDGGPPVPDPASVQDLLRQLAVAALDLQGKLARIGTGKAEASG